MHFAVTRFVRTLQEYSLPLIFGVTAALVWANLDSTSYQALIHFSPLGEGSHANLHFVVNDIFMALFFALAMGEIVESLLPGGPLYPLKKAINPLLGTIGGVLGPVAAYFAIIAIQGRLDLANGWGIPTATDIALAWLVARLVFGAGHPAVSFLLLLAVADDAIGLGIIAIFYPDPNHPVEPIYLLCVVGAMMAAYAMTRSNIQNYWAYLLVPGGLSWVGFFFAHLHPALSLVPVVAMMPRANHDDGIFAEEKSHHPHNDTLNRFQHAFTLPVDIGLFFFGFANAGVAVADLGDATWAILLALAVGKTIGIWGFSYTADRMGFPLPMGMNGRSLLVAGFTASIGLTVALFVAGVAFTEPSLRDAAKMGALLSAVFAPMVWVFAKLLRVGKAEKVVIHTIPTISIRPSFSPRPRPSTLPPSVLTPRTTIPAPIGSVSTLSIPHPPSLDSLINNNKESTPVRNPSSENQNVSIAEADQNLIITHRPSVDQNLIPTYRPGENEEEEQDKSVQLPFLDG